MSQSPQPWLSYRRQCSQTLKHQYTTTLPLILSTTSFLPCDKWTKWPPWTKRPITHQHRATITKVSRQLTDKDSQAIDWQGQPAACLSSGSGPMGVYTSGGFMGHAGAPATHTSTPQDTRPQGLQVAAHSIRAGQAKVRRCGAKLVHHTTQISQSQPPLTTKGSGDLGLISFHKDPTPIGDAGCPWEWPPTDATPGTSR